MEEQKSEQSDGRKPDEQVRFDERSEAVRKAEEVPARKKTDTEKKILRVYVVVLTLVVIAGGIYVFLRHRDNQKEEQKPILGSTVFISEDGRNNGSGTAAQKVADSMVVVKMTPTWIFEDGYSAGNGYIANSLHNKRPLKIRVTLVDTGDVVLETDPIPVGYSAENFKLSKVLEKGEYQAVVEHMAVDEAGEVFNVVRTDVTIIVLN